MRFLFINQYYSPDYAATAQQLSDLCENLASQGHDVHVLTSCAIYDGRKLQLPRFEVLNGVKVHRISLGKNSGRARLRDRFMGYMSFYLKAFLKLHRVPKPDVVVTLTTPPLICLLGSWMRLVRGCKNVNWVMDVYPDIAIEAGVLSKWGLPAMIWSALARAGFRTADRLIVLGEDMKQYLTKKGVPKSRIRVINCWACSNEVFPVEPEENPFCQEMLPSDSFNIMYSGNMGTCHAFQETMDVFEEMDGSEKIQLTFIGGGKQQAELKERLGDKDFVTFYPYQDRTKLAWSLSSPDIHLITLQDKYDGMLVPSKLYAIMAAAKPVLFIGSETNEIARIIRLANCGIVIPPNQPDLMRSSLKELSSDPDKASEMGENGRRYFLEHFNKLIGVNKFVAMFRELVGAPAATPEISVPEEMANDTEGDFAELMSESRFR